MNIVLLQSENNGFSWANCISLVGIVIALLAPYFFRWNNRKKERETLLNITAQLVGSLKECLGRADISGPDGKVKFNQTRLDETSHYFVYFEKMLLPKMDLFSSELQRKLVLMFDEYRKNNTALRERHTIEKNFALAEQQAWLALKYQIKQSQEDECMKVEENKDVANKIKNINTNYKKAVSSVSIGTYENLMGLISELERTILIESSKRVKIF